MKAVVTEVHQRQAAEAAVAVKEDSVIIADALNTAATKQTASKKDEDQELKKILEEIDGLRKVLSRVGGKREINSVDLCEPKKVKIKLFAIDDRSL